VGISAGSNAMTFYAEDETSRADGSRRGGIRAYWAAEAAEKTASQPKFREMEMKLRKVVGLVYATDELLADATALEGWILSNLPEELRFVVEDSILNGTGAGQPQGILASGAVVSVAKETGQAAASIVGENIMKMWARLWNTSRRSVVWLINQDTLPQLMQLQLPVGTGGVPLYMPPGGLSAAPYGTILGRPVLESEYVEKGGVEAASSIHVRFVYDETCFRFVYRVDGQSKWNAALTPKNGTNTVSPFVSLATRA
jgi:HK97 family phage major capsid protein